MSKGMVGIDPVAAHRLAGWWDVVGERSTRQANASVALGARLLLDATSAAAAAREAARGLAHAAAILRARAERIDSVDGWPRRGLDQRPGPAPPAGDDDAATDLIAWLSTGPRGELISDLVSPSAAAWADLVDAGTVVEGPSAVRYLEVASHPGAGVIVVDFFIPDRGSAFLAGDDRSHEDPVFGPLTPDDSRVVMVFDLEHGRASVRVDGTCTAWGGPLQVCNEARPIETQGRELVWEPTAEPGELLLPGGAVPGLLPSLLDVPNQVSVTSSPERIEVDFDLLNGIVPLGSVDGTFTLRAGGDGRYEVAAFDADEYPSVGVYQYRAAGDVSVLLRRDSRGPEFLLPWWPEAVDLPDLPWLG